MSWHKNGKRHRDGDKPAIISPHLIEWYKNDRFHRDGDKPAAIWSNDSVFWLKKGSYHRVGDQPDEIEGVAKMWQRL